MEYRNIIYTAFRPIYYFSKVVGFMPLSYKRKNLKNVKMMRVHSESLSLVWSWLGVLYSCLWIAFLVLFRFVLMPRWGTPPNPPNITNSSEFHMNGSEDNETFHGAPEGLPRRGWSVIASLNQILDAICSILIVLTGVFGVRNLASVFRNVQLLDDYVDEDGFYLLGLTERKNLLRKGLLSSILLVAMCFIYTFSGTFCASFLALSFGGKLKDILPFMIQDTIKLGNATGEAQFLTLCMYLRQRFKILNNGLKLLQTNINKVINNFETKTTLQIWSLRPTSFEWHKRVSAERITALDPLKIPSSYRQRNALRSSTLSEHDPPMDTRDSFADVLSRLCRWHRRLCDVIDMLSSCYELTLIVSIAYCFGSSVFFIYSFLTNVEKVYILHALPDLIWCASFYSRMVLLSVIPALTVKEASKARMLVERLNNRSLDNSSKEEIAIFISHLSSRDISFSVCGFFTLDLQFLRSIAVAIVTYVILLIQFKIK